MKVRKERRVWIAIPAHSGQVHIGTMRSILTDFHALMVRGDKVSFLDECGNAYIDDARALMVAKFLDSDGTDLVFADSDVIWEAGTIPKLVDHDVDFVAAVYPHRKDPITWPISWDQSKAELTGVNGLLEVWGVPFGCCRVSRAMLEKMVDIYSTTEFVCEPAPNHKAWALFGEYRTGKLKLGEDYAFCNRWRDIGGKIYIDPDVKMGHVGFKTFTGNIGEWLKGDRT